MKTLVVTSRATFVPGNYDGLICSLMALPQVAGLLVLDNRRGVLKTALGLVATGAWRTGLNLLANLQGPSHSRRQSACRAFGKRFCELSTINGSEAWELVRDLRVDLILNARTRFIYKTAILEAPRLGCLNIHHGLLPDERGAMCDLWALHEGRPAGFSIHRMAAKIDAGEILRRVEVATGEKDYPRYLKKAVGMEFEVVKDLLAQIESEPGLTGQPNLPSGDKRYRKNPTAAEIRAMWRGGLKL
jgi:methionyl-tRNA formyltransferase